VCNGFAKYLEGYSVGKVIKEQRERERERKSKREKRQLTRGVMLDTSTRSRDIMIDSGIKVFKFCLLDVCKREYGI
jgi:hypothetical protein